MPVSKGGEGQTGVEYLSYLQEVARGGGHGEKHARAIAWQAGPQGHHLRPHGHTYTYIYIYSQTFRPGLDFCISSHAHILQIIVCVRLIFTTASLDTFA